MASKGLGSLTLDLITKTAGFTSGMTKAERATAQFARKAQIENRKAERAFRDLVPVVGRVEDVVKRFASSPKVLGVALSGAAIAGSAAMAAAAIKIVKSQSDIIDATAKAATRVDASYESFKKLSLAAGDAGFSVETLESASLRLNKVMGDALGGDAAAEKNLSRLGLTAQGLAGLSLDEKILAVNNALRDNIPQAERASAAMAIYGRSGATAMATLTDDLVGSYDRWSKAFGLALSESDKGKVESMNDSLARLSMIYEGFATQLTIAVAPALESVSSLLLESAVAAGGIGGSVEKGVRRAVQAIAILASVADGIKRVFVAVGNLIAATFQSIQWAAISATEGVVAAINLLPLHLISKSLDDFMKKSQSSLALMRQGLQATVGELLSDGFGGLADESAYKKIMRFFDDASAKVSEGKESTSDLAEEMERVEKATAKTADKAGDLVAALKKQVEEWGKSQREKDYLAITKEIEIAGEKEKLRLITLRSQADEYHSQLDALESAKKRLESYASLVDGLRTDEQKRTDELRAQLSLISSMMEIEEEERRRVAGAAISRALAGQGSPDVGSSAGALGELQAIDEKREALRSWYDERLALLDNFRAEFSEKMEAWDAAELAAKKEHDAKLLALEQQRAEIMLSANEQIFHSLAEMGKTFQGENSLLYKSMFATEKAFAIARSIMAIQQGVALAAANPFPANLAAMASVAAATAGIVSSIAAVGMAHDGLDEVPKTGTWLLEKGERVITEKTSKKLDARLEKSGGEVTVNLIESASRGGEVARRDDGSIDVFVVDIFSGGKSARALERRYGLAVRGV